MGAVTNLAEFIPGLGLYFKNLMPLLREIRDTVAGNKVDNDFWASIYKENNESGGPYSNGWFNNLYAHVYSQNYQTKVYSAVLKTEDRRFSYPILDGNGYGTDRYEREGFPVKGGREGFGGPKLNNFPSNVSVLGFEWNYYGKLIPMTFIAGVTSVEMADGFLTPKLGVCVLEQNQTP